MARKEKSIPKPPPHSRFTCSGGTARGGDCGPLPLVGRPRCARYPLVASGTEPLELTPNIWQVVHLIESLPIDLRTMLFQTGQLLVNLLDLPERSRQSIAPALRACMSLRGDLYPAPGIFHPRWLFAPREKFTAQPQYDEGEITINERPIIKIHLRRVRTPTGRVRSRLRCLPNPGCTA